MFNGPQLHLLLNHFPIVGFFLLIPLLLLTLITRRNDYKRLALLATSVVGLLVLPAFWTGEPAEEGVEHLSGIAEAQIEAHEEAGEVALALALTTAGLAGTSWFLSRRREAVLRLAMPIVTLAAIGTAGVMAWVGHEGGKIRHPEIVSGGPAFAPSRSSGDDED